MTAELQSELNAISQKINETVEAEKVYLFGSYAYGQPDRDSDYDLYVVIPDGALRPIDAAVRLHEEVHTVSSMPVDIIVCHSSKFHARQKGPTLERKIAREGVLLYDRSWMEQRMA